MLQLVDARSGEVFDEVGIAAHTLVYRTGAAKPILEGIRAARLRGTGIETSDPELYTAVTGWSNGYAALRESA